MITSYATGCHGFRRGFEVARKLSNRFDELLAEQELPGQISGCSLRTLADNGLYLKYRVV